jgi:TPP-dependent pyruvate/acetoin dehydrogenase alpha subunit
MYDPELYRDKAEVEQWKARDPIDLFEHAMLAAGTLTADDRVALDRDVVATVDEAVAFAEAGTLEPVGDLLRFVTREAEVAR